MQIELKNVYYSTKNTNILTDINLKTKPGINVITGKNGSGKSTLLNILKLLYLPTSGAVFIDGQLLNKKNQKQFTNSISIVYQFSDMQFFNLTIKEDLLYSIKIRKMNIEKANEEIIKYLELLNLPKEILNKSPFTISGGEKKKLAIISELILHPKILILDEPTSGLDNHSKQIILNLVQKISTTTTIILVSHDFNDIYDLATNIIEVQDGKIENNLPKKEFFDFKYTQNKTEHLNEVYKIFKMLNLSKSEYEKFLDNNNLFSYIKDLYELH